MSSKETLPNSFFAPPQPSRLCIVTGKTNPEFAEAITESMSSEVERAELDPIEAEPFANGELHAKYGNTIRGAHVFIVQAHSGLEGGNWSINDSIMQSAVMTDAARRASAAKITQVWPYFPYSRQDRKSTGREPISASMLFDMFESIGTDNFMSIDLHSGQIQGFTPKPFDHLKAHPPQVSWAPEYIEDKDPKKIRIVSPDAGRAKLAKHWAEDLGVDWAIAEKTRGEDGVEIDEIVGDIDGSDCIIVDDMVDTAGTLVEAAKSLRNHGAKEINVVTTHALLSGSAVERIKKSKEISKVVATNIMPLESKKKELGKKLEVVNIAPIFGKVILAVYQETSVSEIFGGEGSNLD